MIDKRLIEQLRKKKSPSTIYYLINKIRKEHRFAISKQDAALILAGNMGIDIFKFSSNEGLDRLNRSLVQIKVLETKKDRISRKPALATPAANKTIPFLQPTYYSGCNNMATVYQQLFLFENSVRFFIIAKLNDFTGSSHWWKDKVPNEVRRNVENRKKKEEQNRWHPRRNAHNLFYTDFSDLKLIIKRNWDCFKRFFPNQPWIEGKLQELEFSRNIIAHNNILSAGEINRIKLYFQDWCRQVEDK